MYSVGRLLLAGILIHLTFMSSDASESQMLSPESKLVVVMSRDVVNENLDQNVSALFEHTAGFWGLGEGQRPARWVRETMESEALLRMSRRRAQFICAVRHGEDSAKEADKYSLTLEDASIGPSALLFTFSCR